MTLWQRVKNLYQLSGAETPIRTKVSNPTILKQQKQKLPQKAKFVPFTKIDPIKELVNEQPQ